MKATKNEGEQLKENKKRRIGEKRRMNDNREKYDGYEEGSIKGVEWIHLAQDRNKNHVPETTILKLLGL
jgi:hypothetical protein